MNETRQEFQSSQNCCPVAGKSERVVVRFSPRRHWWWVKHQQAESSYADFHWADIVRTSIHLGNGTNAFEEATRGAIKVAYSTETKGLFGYFAPIENTSHRLN